MEGCLLLESGTTSRRVPGLLIHDHLPYNMADVIEVYSHIAYTTTLRLPHSFPGDAVP